MSTCLRVMSLRESFGTLACAAYGAKREGGERPDLPLCKRGSPSRPFSRPPLSAAFEKWSRFWVLIFQDPNGTTFIDYSLAPHLSPLLRVPETELRDETRRDETRLE